ncbi:Thiamine biosynthesis lipoprotein ApbE precursor [Stieleria maiorica]|uniref:FAD:protein FMN transferase n=1 Tax=Stieleria maiorica TaxID=2795974 RepID=A0A5B9MCZ4_9BACT|nr:FAD:protein FMN transferase [Stieleria maiorica]QEF97117.1 Thiamine biosynthesis lipoprotein ApbE precursor [Stieleria maiorica]
MLTTISHHAMAAEFSVILAKSDAHLVEPALEALELLDGIEADLTVYQDDSEISRINAAASDHPVPVSEHTYRLLRRSMDWSEKTAGAFDVTAGPLVRVWGFTQRRGRKPTTAEVRDAAAKVGYRHVILDDDRRSVAFELPGMEINLGAIGKGFALDELADTLTARGLSNFLIHGGGSSVIARGDQIADGSQDSGSQDSGSQGWAVGISHPTKPKLRLAGIRLHNEALSTSGSGKQFFHHRGRRYGHVIDPRSGFPAGDLLSLTAIASNATDAEACSTAFFVCGIDAIRAAVATDETLPRMIGVRAKIRQDSVEVLPFADFEWVDPPLDEASI